MAAGAPNILLKLSVTAPPKGVTHALQGKDGEIVDARVSTGRTLVFEIPVRLEEGKSGWRFLGDFVRTEGQTGGKSRRFVYVGIGRHAGDPHTEWDRRAKVDLPDVTQVMIRLAQTGKLVLAGSYAGTDLRGGPTCATVKVDWVVKDAAHD